MKKRRLNLIKLVEVLGNMIYLIMLKCYEFFNKRSVWLWKDFFFKYFVYCYFFLFDLVRMLDVVKIKYNYERCLKFIFLICFNKIKDICFKKILNDV